MCIYLSVHSSFKNGSIGHLVVLNFPVLAQLCIMHTGSAVYILISSITGSFFGNLMTKHIVSCVHYIIT